MADNYLDYTVLGYYHNRLTTIFALDSDLDALSARVDDIVAEGGEPNVIEVVKVNNSALTPDANKAVNIDLSGYAETSDLPTYVSELTNDGDGTSPFATEAYVGTYGGKIDVIQVNGTAQTITNKTVNIIVPTAVSDLNNDSGFQTASDVQAAISTAVAAVYKPKGSTAFANLPALTAANKGNVYNVTDAFVTTSDFVEGAGKSYPAGTNVAIVDAGTEQSPSYKYDVLAGFIDTSALWAKTELVPITTAQIDALFA